MHDDPEQLILGSSRSRGWRDLAADASELPAAPFSGPSKAANSDLPRTGSPAEAAMAVDDGPMGTGEVSLFNTTFTVFDLETTGLSTSGASIIEIGAVKVRGGEVIGEFSELIDPGTPIPPAITKLTGISGADVDGKPLLGTVLPQFLDFASGTTWVAHNAPFDVGFVRAACAELSIAWPAPGVVDTLKLSRQLIDKREVRSHRLGSLAKFVGSDLTNAHRALHDARATVDVLHHLLERLAGLNVETNHTLKNFTSTTDPRLRERRSMIADAPHKPGIYIFRGPNGDPLYIGKATDLRTRLGQYFTGADPRRRIGEMVLLSESVETVQCAHAFDAEVREARMLAALRPPYNRQRKEPGRSWWITSPEGQASASPVITRTAKTSDAVVGPFTKQNAAKSVRDALFPTGLSAGFIDSPLPAGMDFPAFAEALRTGGGDLAQMLIDAITDLAVDGRYKRAGTLRDAVATLIDVVERHQRLHALVSVPQLQAARPDGRGGWELAVIRHGRLAAAGHAPRGTGAAYTSQLLADAADTVVPDTSIYGGANHHELGVVHEWLLRDDVRIGPTTTPWVQPAFGMGRWRTWSALARGAASEERSLNRAERD